MIKNFYLDKDSEFTNPNPGVERKILAHGDKMMVCRLSFEKGAIGSLHHHPHTQCTYILSGQFEFTIDGKTVLLKAGDTTYDQGDVEHGCVCIEAGELLDIFTPEREDFLK